MNCKCFRHIYLPVYY